MSATTEKAPPPAYGSFKTLSSFSNEVREGGHVPLQVDRTLMPKLSGSAANETIATLRYLGLVSGEKATPTPLFAKYVMGSDVDRKSLLPDMIRNAYKFLFADPSFDIERASGQQVADLFRAQGIAGSTCTRAVSFFLAAAKEAGLKVSHNVKPPVSRGGAKAKKDKKPSDVPQGQQTQTGSAASIDPVGSHRFELPVPGKDSVIVYIPKSLDAEDWVMFQQMFTIYVERWKRAPANPPAAESVAPAAKKPFEPIDLMGDQS